MKSILSSFTIILLTIFTAQAQSWWGDAVKGKGPIVERTLSVPYFSGFGFNISGDVYLIKGDEQRIVVKGQANLIDLLNTDVNDGFWRIKFTKNVSNIKDFKVYITVPNIEEVSVSGSGDVFSDDTFEGARMDVTLSGSGNIEMAVATTELAAKISGSGTIDLAGKVTDATMSISGSGDINGNTLAVARCKAYISGSGDIRLRASEELNARIVGSGDIYYKGNPRVRSKITGSGEVQQN
ncbi:MAG: head GIN domain-containing protein [Bacteroidota bacterium]